MKAEKLIARARELADELHRAADKLAAGEVASQPERVTRALREAVAALYFGERHKHEQALRRVVASLSPELAGLLDERGAKAAHDLLHAE